MATVTDADVVGQNGFGDGAARGGGRAGGTQLGFLIGVFGDVVSQGGEEQAVGVGVRRCMGAWRW